MIVQLHTRQVTEFVFSAVSDRDEFLDQLTLAIQEYSAEEKRAYSDVAAQFIATNFGTFNTTKRVFGIPLRILLKKQANLHPQLVIPYIMKRLLDHITKYRSYQHQFTLLV